MLVLILCLQLRSALGKQGDAQAVDRIMSRADVNGDGEISYDEYYRLMNMDKFGDAAVQLGIVSCDLNGRLMY